MNIQDAYIEFPELMTEFEQRHMDDDSIYEKTPRCLWSKMGRNAEEDDDDDELDEMGIMADGFNKENFDRRKPAFGWGEPELESIQDYADKSDYDEYIVFKLLRDIMCRRLICASGATTVSELCGILRNEMESGVPAPAPEWYKFGTKTGPDTGKKRRFGYQPCTARGCPNTEDLERQFQQCTRCKLATYCSKECQTKDWKERHKKVCPLAKERHDMTLKAASVIHQYTNMFDG